MILVSYDGSADAQEAVDRAAELTPNAEATVLTVWEPVMDVLARTSSFGDGMGMATAYVDSEAVDAASRDAALATATAGARRATQAGLIARPARSRAAETWPAPSSRWRRSSTPASS